MKKRLKGDKRKMIVAIPLFKDRISPHFGSSSKVLMIEVKGNTVCKEFVWNMDEQEPLDMARRLINSKVEEIVCGGIQASLKEWLVEKGIVVVDNQEGPAGTVVRRLLKPLKDGHLEADR